MGHTGIIYLTFSILLVTALIIDLGFISKKEKEITMKAAAVQTAFWVSLSLAFWLFIWINSGTNAAAKYIGAYLMEWSLSMDNIFVFILIFGLFPIKKKDIGRTLLLGILVAILLRIIFITIGIGLIDRFHGIMYLFGAFLLYTGIRLFVQKEQQEYTSKDSKFVYWIQRILPFTNDEAHGKFIIKKEGKPVFTMLSLVAMVLAITDIAFALDSIPTVVSLIKDGISDKFSQTDIVIIYTSNIFAVLGLRSLFFLLKGAANKFRYLQKGIACILIFIGLKMLVVIAQISIPIFLSLGVIVLCVGISILWSIKTGKK